jgi:hypothetical protein
MAASVIAIPANTAIRVIVKRTGAIALSTNACIGWSSAGTARGLTSATAARTATAMAVGSPDVRTAHRPAAPCPR